MTQKSKPSFVRYFDGEIYTRYFSRSYNFVTTLTGWRKKIARHALKDLPKGRLLDIGCGTGLIMSLARKSGFETYGIDPSIGMLEKARIIRENWGHLVCGSADHLPFPDESFDVVCASGSLVYVPDMETTSREIHRVLKTGGSLRIIDHARPKRKNLFTPVAHLFSKLSGDILHDFEYYFSKWFQPTGHKTLGRGGFMQLFDFEKKSSLNSR